MSTWTAEQLEVIERNDEIRISTQRPDGTMRRGVIIWAVQANGDVYVRSASPVGPARWFQRAKQSGLAHIQVADLELDVSTHAPDAAAHEGIDAAYHAKYDRYGVGTVGTVTGPHAYDGTLRLEPRQPLSAE